MIMNLDIMQLVLSWLAFIFGILALVYFIYKVRNDNARKKYHNQFRTDRKTI